MTDGLAVALDGSDVVSGGGEDGFVSSVSDMLYAFFLAAVACFSNVFSQPGR